MKQHELFNTFYNELINKQLQNYPVAHRGIIRLHESTPENSLTALKHCISEGVRFMEIDLQKTKDGKLILMHDLTVDRMTNGSGAIQDMTLAEIKSLNLYEGSGKNRELTTERVPTFEEALDVLRDNAIANVDKGWEYREDVYRILKKRNDFQHVIIKSDAEIKEVHQYLQSKDYSIHYMHKVFNKDVEYIEEVLRSLRPTALEISYYDKDETIVSIPFIQRLQEKTNVWLNALDVSANAGTNDSLSLDRPDEGWGWQIGRSPNFIQTDYSILFNSYKETNN